MSIFSKIFSALFSMRFMAFLLLLFFVAIGYATFIENDFGTQTAKALIYNAKWFEIVIVLLTLNMFYNIKRYGLWNRKKIPVLIFHLAFIVIAIGAGITRYISYEGMMHIREGEMSNQIISDQTYLQIKIHDQKHQYVYDKNLILHNYSGPFSFLKSNNFSHDISFKKNNIKITYEDFIPNVRDTLLTGSGGRVIHIVMAGKNGRENFYLREGTAEQFLGINFSFGNIIPGYINFIFDDENNLMIKSPQNGSFLRMADQFTGQVQKDSLQPVMLRSLYQILGQSIVIPNFYENAEIKYFSDENKNDQELSDLLIVNVNNNGKTKKVELFGDKGFVSVKNKFQIDDLYFSLSYGSKYYNTPFYIKLKDFQLERYPGSNSPSSFASEVTLLHYDISQDHRIYMNNVLDYNGYRFFQSSYDEDELGTVLSVNHDFWGTLITYIGYFLMSLGMILTIFYRNTRFSFLKKKLNDLKSKRFLIIILFTFISNFLLADSKIDSLLKTQSIPSVHADKFGMLVVQDEGGRMKPVNTIASEVLRKVSRKSSFKGLSANQVFLGMCQNPYLWQLVPMIKVNNEALRKDLGFNEKYNSFLSFFSDKAKYILTDEVEKAYAKKPAERNKYDKEVIAVDERVNICYMVYNGSLLRLFPLPSDSNNKWFSDIDNNVGFKGNDSLFVYSILPIYYNSIQQSIISNNFSISDNTVDAIKNYQIKFGSEVIPTEINLKLEYFYNELKIFNKLSYVYALTGLFMLILLIIQILNYTKWRAILIKLCFWIISLAFLIHTLGLATRWIISGHAPWSNAYESVIYIAWSTILSGYIFSKKNELSMAATSILSSLLLMVAGLNWLDPTITNLVPVLDSYWLLIHVAIITASYGFLALGAILGFLNLILMIIQNKNNINRISSTLKELTHINEMSITVGLFMLSIGTFLGGVWANESWGRYWGWDPKETWAFASMLIYIFVLHMRFIPKLKGVFAFNIASIIAYGSIIMTYFGVNFYLSGLHSYAAGDPMPIPSFIPWSIVVLFITTIIAYINNKRLI